MPRPFAKVMASARGHWSLLAVTVVYLVTLGVMPRHGLWIVDNENRFLQVEALADANFREYAIRWPGHDVDPSYALNPLRFNPEGTFQELKDGQLISVFQPAFIVISALAYKVLGFWGLNLVPLVGAVLMLAGVARLAAALHLGPKAAHLAVLLTGLATPAWFYSQNLWEHTTAAALCVWGVVHVVRFLEGRSLRQLAIGYAFLVAAVFFRDVLALFAMVLLALLLFRVPEQRPRIAMTAGAVFAAGLVLLMAFQWVTTGRPLGFHAGTLMNTETGLGAHLRMRPMLFYLYFVASHPDRVWSFVLAAPFLAAFLIRPRLSPSRLSTAVPLWALAAAAAGMVFLVGFLTTPSPPQRMLVANGFFLVSPVLILGLLRGNDDRRPAEFQGAELVLAAACWYFVLYCLVAPWAGAVSLHWGGRLLFTLYPLLAVLAAGTLVRWFDAVGRRVSWRVSAVAVLLLVSGAGQLYSVNILGEKKAYCERLAHAVERFPQPVVITNVWWVGHEMYASFFDKSIFFIKTQAQFDALAATLRSRGIDQVLFAARPQPGAGQNDAVRVEDGTWGFYSLDLFIADLR
jgi:hypothetical protein